VPVNASGGQGNDFPAPSFFTGAQKTRVAPGQKSRVAPDLIRGLVPTTQWGFRNNQIQLPAARA
jgi:hypothetical protein